jgi:hypothetical protein
MSLSIDEREEQSFEQDDSNDVPPSNIVAYNELKKRCQALCTRFNDDGTP